MREILVQSLSEVEDMTVVGSCADGETAIELVLRERPDVVVMDLRLPGVDGLEATRRILEAWPPARVLVHTTDTRPAQVTAAISSGAAAVVPKSTDADDLVRTLRRLAGT
jgi:DNA-binding NarL/FixJ family response regulator